MVRLLFIPYIVGLECVYGRRLGCSLLDLLFESTCGGGGGTKAGFFVSGSRGVKASLLDRARCKVGADIIGIKGTGCLMRVYGMETLSDHDAPA